MTIDLRRDKLIKYKELAPLVPRPKDKKPPNTGSIFRWYRSGVDGIYLELVFVNGQLYGTEKALFEFLDKVSAARISKPFTTAKAKGKASARKRAKRVLDRAGV